MESFLTDCDSPLVDRVTGKVKSLNDSIPLLVSDASEVPTDTKKVQLDVHGYKQSIEKENLQAEREVAQARAEHVTESSSTTREVKDNVESTTRVTKTRKVVQTVTAMKTRITYLGQITDDMISSIDEMFKQVPLLDSTFFTWSLERSEETDAIIITRRVMRAALTTGDNSEGVASSRSLIFIPREPIPYRQLTAAASEETVANCEPGPMHTDVPVSAGVVDSQPDAPKGANGFVLEIKRKEGLRTLWQETAPIKSNRVAEKLTRLELDLQENMFELLTSEASYGQSLFIVLTQLFNVDCVTSSEVVVSSENDPTAVREIRPAGSASNLVAAASPKPINASTHSSTTNVAAEFVKLVKPLDRKALQLNLEDLHRNSVSLLDALKKCWITDSCLMKPSFVQVLADRLSDPGFRAAYLAYLRDVRYQQDLLRELTQCSRALADAGASPNGPSPGSPPADAAGTGSPDAEEHLCIADRYSRAEVHKIRAIFADFLALKCVENRAVQSFLLLPLERLTKLKMCLESCEKLACKLLARAKQSSAAPHKEASPCALAQLGVDLDETRRVLHVCLTACCSLLDQSNRLTHTCMQAEAQLQLDRLICFEPAFGLRRISVVRTERLFLKDDSGSLLRFHDAPPLAGAEPARKSSKPHSLPLQVRAESLTVRLFLFSDLLLLAVDSRRRNEALAHFGMSAAAHETKGVSFLERLRKSIGRKHTGARLGAGSNGPVTGKFACGTADLARVVAGIGTLIVLDYAVISPRNVRVALFDSQKFRLVQSFPPQTDEEDGCPKQPAPASSSTKPRGGDSKRLFRSHSTVPAVLQSLDNNASTESRRTSECVRHGKSLVNLNGQVLELDAAIRAYCEQSAAQNESKTPDCTANILRITLLENGVGERAEYAFRFAAESDAPRWFDALADAIASASTGGLKHDNQLTLDGENDHHIDNGSTVNPGPYTVLRPHNPSYGEELELAKGDTVTLLKRTADNWCKGTLLGTSKSGWFRANCIE